VSPEVEHFASFPAEVDYIAEYLTQAEDSGENLHEICLVARTHELLKQYEGALKSKGLETYFIRRDEAEDRRKVGVRLATMHRVKGLEFDRVIIAGVNDGVLPLEVEWNKSNDQVIQRESENQEKALLYVAVTRAKREVIVTSFGKASKLLTT
jgi:superfamily I DNA/RNA helicase